MPMSVTFGTTTDPVFCVNKDYTTIKTINGNPIEPENILYPTFLVDYDDDLLDCNYCFVSADTFNRFYFCRVTTENGNNLRIDCSVDALQSWWHEFQNDPMTIIRSSSFNVPTYVQDGMLPVDAQRIEHTYVMEFNSIHDAGSRNVDYYDVLVSI